MNRDEAHVTIGELNRLRVEFRRRMPPGELKEWLSEELIRIKCDLSAALSSPYGGREVLAEVNLGPGRSFKNSTKSPVRVLVFADEGAKE